MPRYSLTIATGTRTRLGHTVQRLAGGISRVRDRVAGLIIYLVLGRWAEKAGPPRSTLCEDLQVRTILVEVVTGERDSNFLGTIQTVAVMSRSHEQSRLYVAEG